MNCKGCQEVYFCFYMLRYKSVKSPDFAISTTTSPNIFIYFQGSPISPFLFNHTKSSCWEYTMCTTALLWPSAVASVTILRVHIAMSESHLSNAMPLKAGGPQLPLSAVMSSSSTCRYLTGDTLSFNSTELRLPLGNIALYPRISN
jgi:hypothetical protein